MARKRKAQQVQPAHAHTVPTLDGIKVYCGVREDGTTSWTPRLVSELKPHPHNPNKHGERQVKLLTAIVKEAGWRAPIIVSLRSGYITKGHCRLMVAKALGVRHVPVEMQVYNTEAEELADMVADNRIAELADLDYDDVGRIMDTLRTEGFDMTLTGFDQTEVESLFATAEAGGHTRPTFDGAVEQFEQAAGRKPCEKNGQWLYVEYYADERAYNEVKAQLGDMVLTDHLLDPKKFAGMARAYAAAGVSAGKGKGAGKQSAAKGTGRKNSK